MKFLEHLLLRNPLGLFMLPLALALLLLLWSIGYAGTLQATLDWQNPVDITDGVQVEKAAGPTGTFSMLVQLPANSIKYVDATNGPGDVSCFRVAYFTTSGVGAFAGPVCKTFPPLPSQTPANFTVK